MSTDQLEQRQTAARYLGALIGTLIVSVPVGYFLGRLSPSYNDIWALAIACVMAIALSRFSPWRSMQKSADLEACKLQHPEIDTSTPLAFVRSVAAAGTTLGIAAAIDSTGFGVFMGAASALGAAGASFTTISLSMKVLGILLLPQVYVPLSLATGLAVLAASIDTGNDLLRRAVTALQNERWQEAYECIINASRKSGLLKPSDAGIDKWKRCVATCRRSKMLALASLDRRWQYLADSTDSEWLQAFICLGIPVGTIFGLLAIATGGSFLSIAGFIFCLGIALANHTLGSVVTGMVRQTISLMSDLNALAQLAEVTISSAHTHAEAEDVTDFVSQERPTVFDYRFYCAAVALSCAAVLVGFNVARPKAIDNVNSSSLPKVVAAAQSDAELWDRLATSKNQSLFEILEPQAERELQDQLGHGKAFQGHDDMVCRVVFSYDGQFIVSVGKDRKAILWDCDTWKRRRVFEGNGASMAAAFAPMERTFVFGRGTSVEAWDAETRYRTWSVDYHDKTVLSLSFSSDGETVASGSGDGTVVIMDTKTGEVVERLNPNVGGVWSIKYLSDYPYLVIGGEHGSVVIWDMLQKKAIKTLSGGSEVISSLSTTVGGDYLVSSCWDGKVRLWDTLLFKPYRQFSTLPGGAWAAAVAPNGKELVASGTDLKTRVWSITSGELTRTLEIGGDAPLGVAYSPDGRFLVAGTGPKRNLVYVWKRSH